MTFAPEAHKTAGVLELKPCPFCNGEPRLFSNSVAINIWRVQCIRCDAGPSGSMGKPAAIVAWNTRSTPSVPAVAELSGGLALGVAGAAEGNLLTAAKKALAFYDSLDREHDPGEAAVLDALDTAVRAALTASPAGDDPKALDAAARSSSTEAVEQEVERLRKALTPSADTKAAYAGEFFEPTEVLNAAYDPDDEDSEEPETIIRKVPVSWDTIKEIMAAIRDFARPSPVTAACKPEGETSLPGKEEGR